jgi:coatomer protein complex subunit epsilon
MSSSELYYTKQQFTLGAYPTLVSLPLPDSSSPEYTPTLLYKVRAHLALGDTSSALALIPSDTENVTLRAAAALARGEEGLEALRDLCVEIEGDEDTEDWEKELVIVLAGAAFVRAGEIEEALETLGGEGKTDDEPSVLLSLLCVATSLIPRLVASLKSIALHCYLKYTYL